MRKKVKRERLNGEMSERSNNNYVPKFVGHYDHWAKLIENIFCSKGYWNIVDHGVIVNIAGERRFFSSMVAEKGIT